MTNGNIATLGRRLAKLENSQWGARANLGDYRAPWIVVREGEDADQITKEMEARGEIPRKLRQRWEKLSEYPVWITFSGLPGPEIASTRQTQAPTTTLNASQIRRSVIVGRPHTHPSRKDNAYGPLQFPTQHEIWQF